MVGIVQTGKGIASEFSEKNVTFMAAGIAYNAFISLAPILLILLLIVSAVGGGLEERIIAIARNSLPRPIADVIAGVFQGDSASSGASVVGLLVLIWGTLKIFRGLDTAFSEIYETTGKNSFVDQVMDGLVVLVSVLVAIVATVGVTAAFAVLSDTLPYVGVLTPVVLVVGLVIAFLPMYYRFPDVDVDWKHVLPGVVFAAVGWAAFQALFQVYLSFTGGSSGSLFGGVIVIITWLYFSGLVLLLGAVINAVIGGYSSGKAGGVGQGASSYETKREEVLDRDQLADYLRELREELTGHYEEMCPAIGAERTDRYPQPDDDIEVIEQSSRDGDEEKWTVAFRWRTTDDGSEGRSGSADD